MVSRKDLELEKMIDNIFILGQGKNGYLFLLEFSLLDYEIKLIALEKMIELVGFTKLAINNMHWKQHENKNFELSNNSFSSLEELQIFFPAEENFLTLCQFKNNKFQCEKIMIMPPRSKSENICCMTPLQIDTISRNIYSIVMTEENSCNTYLIIRNNF
jgi:hypothetical protein